MTEKLYYRDSHIDKFTAICTDCQKSGDGWAVYLDKTAFFPEGGGQPGDTGTIGQVNVTDTKEINGEPCHYTDSPLVVGESYSCAIDWPVRFGRMQNHSGEHIVSGLVHKLYGYDNVGFHMGTDCVTIDFNGELDGEALEKIERLANKAVTDNLPVSAVFPSAAELENMDYRSKKELTGKVRIVTIEGVDVCACCAPHVGLTGEIGIIKLLSSMRHRGGVRIDMLCGGAAVADYRAKHESVAQISARLSAKQSEVVQAVDRIIDDNEKLKYRIGALSAQLVKAKLEDMEETQGNICIFDELLDENALRELVNGAVLKCSGIVAAFSGSDKNGYRYIIGSRTTNLRNAVTAINNGIGGRGGGKPEMIQGSASKTSQDIQDFLSKYEN